MSKTVARLGFDLAIDGPVGCALLPTPRQAEQACSVQSLKALVGAYLPYMAHHAAGGIVFAVATTKFLVKMPRARAQAGELGHSKGNLILYALRVRGGGWVGHHGPRVGGLLQDLQQGELFDDAVDARLRELQSHTKNK
eukprot:1337650-Pleurochrysis_carterae.AAC.1